jgi:fructose-bisphosphate aldolase, class I
MGGNLPTTAQMLVADGKGLLAADETVAVLTKRFESYSILSKGNTRGAYRELFFTTPGIGEFLSGVIMHDETIRQRGSQARPLVEVLAAQGVATGIKVDAGPYPLAGAPAELVTEGLDGLRDRLKHYGMLGAVFAKWRAAIHVSSVLPTAACIHANAHALARYAALCQEQGLVPILEADVLMDGSHTIARCEEVTGAVLHALFAALHDQQVLLEGVLLQPNMVTAGKTCPAPAPVHDAAFATLRCVRRHVPAVVPGIVFLSGGQDPLAATIHLNVINQIEGPRPWPLGFSYGRALQDEALQIWRGRCENLRAAQAAFYHRAKCASAAVRGKYVRSMENTPAVASVGGQAC